MIMVMEDYISFETAKLLKEKGFRCDTLHYYYDKDGGLLFSAWSVVVGKNEFSAPTIQMAMRWLEEVHHILVVADYVYECTDTSWVYKIYRLDENGKPERCAIRGTRYDKRMDTYVDEIVGYRDYDMSYKDYETRAEAEEDGIKSVLENL